MENINIFEHWGENNLIRIPTSLLQTTKFPAETKDFLHQIGLPKQFRIYSGLEFKALPIKAVISHDKTISEPFMLQLLPNTPYRILAFGEVNDFYLCVEEDQGIIKFADRERRQSSYDLCFINSGIQSFTECMMTYEIFGNTEQLLTKSKVDKFKQHLEKIDSHAFDEQTHYWPLVIEDMKNYLW